MDDYISREAALKVFCDWCCVCPKEKRKPLECDDILGNVLKALPAADVRPVADSYWEKDPDGLCVCHKCRKQPLLDGSEEPVLSDYCPNCGAKMEEKHP